MTTTPEPRRPDPAARHLVRSALAHYEHGLSASEVRRRCSTRGVIHVVGEDGTNRTEELAVVLEYLLDAGLVEQRLVGRSVRFVDAIKFPTTTNDSETAS